MKAGLPGSLFFHAVARLGLLPVYWITPLLYLLLRFATCRGHSIVFLYLYFAFYFLFIQFVRSYPVGC